MHRRPLRLALFRLRGLLGPLDGGLRGCRPGALDHRPEGAVAGRPLDQPHPGRPDHIGPARGGRPEDVVVLLAGRPVSGFTMVLIALVGLLPRIMSVVVVMVVLLLLDVVRVHAHLP
ncbi:hypothetical protein GCM10010504_11570 [Streptomyces griseus]|nr:hypothetical protein GCM10010504_11570 [Streptomyces griseus]